MRSVVIVPNNVFYFRHRQSIIGSKIINGYRLVRGFAAGFTNFAQQVVCLASLLAEQQFHIGGFYNFSHTKILYLKDRA